MTVLTTAFLAQDSVGSTGGGGPHGVEHDCPVFRGELLREIAFQQDVNERWLWQPWLSNLGSGGRHSDADGDFEPAVKNAAR